VSGWGAEHLPIGALRERHDPIQELPPRDLLLSTLSQPFGGVLAYRLQHPIPQPSGMFLRHHQRLVGEGGEQIQNFKNRDQGRGNRG